MLTASVEKWLQNSKRLSLFQLLSYSFKTFSGAPAPPINLESVTELSDSLPGGILKTHSAGMEIRPFRTVSAMVSKGMLT